MFSLCRWKSKNLGWKLERFIKNGFLWKKRQGNKNQGIWFKERDRNMRFFHRMTNAHRRRDQMARVKIDGVWVTQDKDLRVAVGRAFQLLLFTNDDWRPNLSELSFERFEDSEITGLEKPFT